MHISNVRKTHRSSFRVSASMYKYLHGYEDIQRPEVNVCLPASYYYYFFLVESLTQPKIHQFVNVGWSVSLKDPCPPPPCLCFSCVRILSMYHCTWVFCMGSGDQPSSCGACTVSTRVAPPTLSATLQFTWPFHPKMMKLTACHQLADSAEDGRTALIWFWSILLQWVPFPMLLTSYVSWSEIVGEALKSLYQLVLI